MDNNIIGTPLELISDNEDLNDVLKKIGKNQQVLYEQIVKIVDFYRTSFADIDHDEIFSSQILQGNIISVTIKNNVLYIYYKKDDRVKHIKFNLYPFSEADYDDGEVAEKNIIKLVDIIYEGRLPLVNNNDYVYFAGHINKYTSGNWIQLTDSVASKYYYANGSNLYDFVDGDLIPLITGTGITPQDVNNIKNSIITDLDTRIQLAIANQDTTTRALINNFREQVNSRLTQVEEGLTNAQTTLVELEVRLNDVANDLNITEQALTHIAGTKIPEIENEIETIHNTSGDKSVDIIPVLSIDNENINSSIGSDGDYVFTRSRGILKKTNNTWSHYPSYNPSSAENRYPNTYIAHYTGLYRILGTYSNYYLVRIANSAVIVVDYWRTEEPSYDDLFTYDTYWLDNNYNLHKYRSHDQNYVITWDDIPLKDNTLYVGQRVLSGEGLQYTYPDVYYYNGTTLVSIFDGYFDYLYRLETTINNISQQIEDIIGGGGSDEEQPDYIINDKDFLIYDIATGNPGAFTFLKKIDDVTVDDVRNVYTVQGLPSTPSKTVTCTQLGLHKTTLANTNDASFDATKYSRDNYNRLKNAINNTDVECIIVDGLYAIYGESSGAYYLNVNRDIKFKGAENTDATFICQAVAIRTTASIEIDGVKFIKFGYANGQHANNRVSPNYVIAINPINGIDRVIIKNCEFTGLENRRWSHNGNWIKVYGPDYMGLMNKYPLSEGLSGIQARGNHIIDEGYVNHLLICDNRAENKLISATGATFLKTCRIIGNRIHSVTSDAIGIGSENTMNNDQTFIPSRVRNNLSCPTYIVGNEVSGIDGVYRQSQIASGDYYCLATLGGQNCYVLHNNIYDFVACAKKTIDKASGDLGYVEHGTCPSAYDVYIRARRVFFVNNTVHNLIRYNFRPSTIGASDAGLTSDLFGTLKMKGITSPFGWANLIETNSLRVYRGNNYSLDLDEIRFIINNSSWDCESDNPTDNEISAAAAELLFITGADIQYSGSSIVGYDGGQEEYSGEFTALEYLDDDLVEIDSDTNTLVLKEDTILRVLDVAKAVVRMNMEYKAQLLAIIDDISTLQLGCAAGTYADPNVNTQGGRVDLIDFSNNTIEYPGISGPSAERQTGCRCLKFNNNHITCDHFVSDVYKPEVLCGYVTDKIYGLFSVEACDYIEIKDNVIDVGESCMMNIVNVRYSESSSSRIYKADFYNDTTIIVQGNIIPADCTLALHKAKMGASGCYTTFNHITDGAALTSGDEYVNLSDNEPVSDDESSSETPESSSSLNVLEIVDKLCTQNQNPTAGDCYYDVTTGKLKYYDGTSSTWKTLGVD